jgi:hypothetical protein
MSSFNNKITVYDEMDAPDTSGTSLKGHLSYGITYNDLLDYFGRETFGESGDGKVKNEWVIEFETEENGIQLFTIYDWKVESKEWSKINTGSLEQAEDWLGGSRWHIGGKEYAGDFIEFIEKDLKEVKNKLPF